ncbi:MAG: c-type cytochrome domain-containing protein [Verrucomicrobiota bacterium]
MRTPFSILARIARWIVAIPPTLGIVSARAAEPAPSPGIEIARSDRTDPVDFYREVVPILQVNCLPCHNKTTTKADLLLETPADMLKGGESGPAVVPGKSSDSLLLQLAAHRQKPRMPPKDNKVNAVNLSPQDLGLLALWIDQGAKTTGHAEERITWKPLPAGLTPILSVAVAPDGQFAAAGRGNRIDLYHLPTGTWVGSLTDPALESGAHRDWVNALAFSPDGRTLASGGFREIKIWTQETPQWKPAAIPATAVVGTNGSWRSPDGLRVATQGTNGAVILSDGSGTRIAELRIHPEEKLALTRARADVDRSRRTQEREKARLEAAEKEVQAQLDRSKKARDAATAAAKILAEKDAVLAAAQRELVLATVRREVAERLAAGNTNAPDLKAAEERVKSTRTAQEKAEGDQRPAALKASTSDNELVLSFEGIARAESTRARALWRLREAGDDLNAAESALKIAEMNRDRKSSPPVAVAFSPDNLWIATADPDGRITRWAATNGIPVDSHRAPGAVRSLTFTAADQLAVRTTNESLTLDLKPHWTWLKTLSGTNDSRLGDRVNALAFNPDGQWLASGSGEPSRSGDLWFWDTRTWVPVFGLPQLHSDAVLSVAFSPDGRSLASGGADRFARLVDVASGRQVRIFEGHTGHVLGVGWRSDGQSLATAGADLQVKFWDPASGERRKVATGFGHEVTAIVHLPGTDHWLAGSGDGGLRVLNENGEKVRSLTGGDDFTQSVAITQDGQTVVAGGQDGALRVWSADQEQPRLVFPSETPAPATASKP